MLLSVTPALYIEWNSHLCLHWCYSIRFFLSVCTCTNAHFLEPLNYWEILRHICILTPQREVLHLHTDILGPFTPSSLSPPFSYPAADCDYQRASSHPPPGLARTILNPAQLAGFQQANLIFLNTGLCFSFITAGAGGESKGYRGKAQLIGLLEKPVDLNIKEE